MVVRLFLRKYKQNRINILSKFVNIKMCLNIDNIAALWYYILEIEIFKFSAVTLARFYILKLQPCCVDIGAFLCV